MSDKSINLVIVTGMNGTGKAVAIQSSEDLGYFTIDNMPPALVPKFIELIEQSSDNNRVAFVVDMRNHLPLDEINSAPDKIDADPRVDFKILFLDATGGELVARYKETRRSRPLVADERILDGIKLKHELLAPLKNLSQNVVDTTEFTPRQLRKTVSERFSSEENQAPFRIEVMSFGFKYGLLLSADLVSDMRLLPNPYYRPGLRDQTGLEQEVCNYVMNHEESEDLYRHLTGSIKSILPGYQKEGKSVLTIAIGCTGGQHCSVASTRRLAEELRENWAVSETHCDKSRRKETMNCS